MTNSLAVLVPSHFLELLAERIGSAPVRLVPYDRHGVPVENSASVTALFRWWISVEQGDRLILDHPRLDWIHTGSTGVDHILTPAFRSRAITLTNSRGVHAPSIAEWVVATILATEKDLGSITAQQRDRIWKQLERRELSTLRITILGGGAIAREVVHRLAPFGPRITVVTRSGDSSLPVAAVAPVSDLHETTGECDWLILALPLTPATRGLVDGELLSRLPSGARLINVSRGEIVDQAALLRALEGGTIAGAVLDVFETEPLPQDHPFWSMPQVTVLPHTTWKSPQVRERQIDLFVHNLLQRSRGGPLQNVVDLDKGY